MALVAEEIVEEWLRRQGFFTIRGLRVGGGEMDLLAMAMRPTGPECRHIEVNAAVNPANYISGLPKAFQKSTGRGASSAGRREPDILRQGVAEWVEKKYRDHRKVAMRQRLCDAKWSLELVVNVVKYDQVELPAIEAAGITIHRLDRIRADLVREEPNGFRACGSDLVDLLLCPAVAARS